MPEEVAPGIFRLPIPLPDSPLGTVNVYAVVADDGVRLVDCGWNTPQAYETIARELATLGGGIDAVVEILITHIHPDHFGLAERLATESGASVSMHRVEATYVGARYGEVHALLGEMEEWLRVHGVPDDELEAMTEASLGLLKRVGTRRPDVILEGGEVLAWGTRRLETLWTPGHSAGLICLYDRDSRLLFSSDHVLQRISPHVGLHTQSPANPLHDFLQSLSAVRDLPVDVVLPGHGKPFEDLAGRVDALQRHHQKRLTTMESILGSGEQTAYAVSSRLSWRGAEDGWTRLAPFQRRMALTETIAHLEYLYLSEVLLKRSHDGVVVYRCP
jgi:glyoxylase-like metal-dependent hydrolase (beta-lactamase superfamily II)